MGSKRERLQKVWNGQLPLSTVFFGYWLGGGFLAGFAISFLFAFFIFLASEAIARCVTQGTGCFDFIGYAYILWLFIALPVFGVHALIMLRSITLSGRRQRSTLFRYLTFGITIAMIGIGAAVFLQPGILGLRLP